MLNKSIPMQAQANNLRLCHKYHELEILCPIELMLIVKIIPFMFIVAQHKGVQRELKEKCIPVQADLIKKNKNFQDLLMRNI